MSISSYLLEVGDRRHSCRDMPERRGMIIYADEDDVALRFGEVLEDLVPWAGITGPTLWEMADEVDVEDGAWTVQVTTEHGDLIATLRPVEVTGADRRQLDLELAW